MKSVIPTMTNRSINFWILCLILISYPYSLKVCNASIILFGIHWLIWAIRKPREITLRNHLLWLLCLPFLMTTFSLLYTSNIKEGLYVLDKKFSLMVFPLVLGSIPRLGTENRNRLLLLFCMVMACAGIICFVAATHRHFNNLPGGFFWNDFAKPIHLMHPTYFSIVLNFLIFYLGSDLITRWSDLSRMQKMAAFFLIFVFFVFLFLLSSKIQLILSTLIFVYFVYTLRRILPLRVLVAVFVVVFIVVAGSLRNSYTLKRFMSIRNFEYKIDAPVETFNELTIRFAIIESAWSIVKENFWFGVGNGDVQTELDKAYRKFDYKFGYLDQHNPHNEYLSQLLAIGLVGLTVFLFSIYVPLRLAIQRRDRVYIAFLIIFAVSFPFESFLERQNGIVFFGMMNSFLLFTSE